MFLTDQMECKARLSLKALKTNVMFQNEQMDGFRFDPTKFIVGADGHGEQDTHAPLHDLHAHEPHGDDASIFSFLQDKAKEESTYNTDVDPYSAQEEEIVGELKLKTSTFLP